MTSARTINRVKKIEQVLKPTAKGNSNAGPIALWRQDVDTQLCRPEDGGPWVDEETMLESLPTPAQKKHVRLVVVRGCWSQLEQRN